MNKEEDTERENDERTPSVQEIKTFRTMMATLRNYDWVPLPVMYPQLIFLAVHTSVTVSCSLPKATVL